MVRVAASYGATLDEQTLPAFFNADAPTDRVWAASGTHALCVALEQNGHKWAGLAAEVYADVLERMAYGLEDCDDPECDACEENYLTDAADYAPEMARKYAAEALAARRPEGGHEPAMEVLRAQPRRAVGATANTGQVPVG